LLPILGSHFMSTKKHPLAEELADFISIAYRGQPSSVSITKTQLIEECGRFLSSHFNHIHKLLLHDAIQKLHDLQSTTLLTSKLLKNHLLVAIDDVLGRPYHEEVALAKHRLSEGKERGNIHEGVWKTVTKK